MSKKVPAPSQSDPTRDLAFDILCGVFEHRRMLETTMDRSAINVGRDRASAHRLAATVLRYYGSMHETLRPLLRKEPPVPVLCALLMGVAQLRYLQTPAHAAVGTIVSLLRRRKLTHFTGLANAVLRRVAREGDALEDGLDKQRLDVPSWLWSAWGGRARAIASGLHQEAPLDIFCKPGVSPPTLLPEARATAADDNAVSALKSAGRDGKGREDAPPTIKHLPNGALRYPPGTRVTLLQGYADGDFWVQDAAAGMAVSLMGDLTGRVVIDLCAAPGGKTAQLACKGAQVRAIEKDPARMARLRENLSRLKLDVQTVEADALTWRPQNTPDVVLLDAPCSATGTFRRHPDVLWIKRPRDILTLVEHQDALIDAAGEMLKKGGLLYYVVCSLQDEEGPQRVQAATQRGWTLKPFNADECGDVAFGLTPEGTFRTHPGMWSELGGLDGFFVARLQRV